MLPFKNEQLYPILMMTNETFTLPHIPYASGLLTGVKAQNTIFKSFTGIQEFIDAHFIKMHK